jgi:hypothetical protein
VALPWGPDLCLQGLDLERKITSPGIKLTRIPAHYAIYEICDELVRAKRIEDGGAGVRPGARELSRVYVAHFEPTFDCLEEKATGRIEEGGFDYRCDRD